MHLEDRIEAIGCSIGTIVERLNEHGFEFERPDDVFPGPEAGAAEAIERIEHETGILPLALKQFWLRVGSVDLCGARGWLGCEYPDPLVIAPPSFAVGELEDFLADREERQRHEYPYVVETFVSSALNGLSTITLHFWVSGDGIFHFSFRP